MLNNVLTGSGNTASRTHLFDVASFGNAKHAKCQFPTVVIGKLKSDIFIHDCVYMDQIMQGCMRKC